MIILKSGHEGIDFLRNNEWLLNTQVEKR